MSLHTEPSMTDPYIERRRPAPRLVPWSPRDLARRRSLDRARSELEAATARADRLEVLDAWRGVVSALVDQERRRVDPPAPDARHRPGCPARLDLGPCDRDCYRPTTR